MFFLDFDLIASIQGALEVIINGHVIHEKIVIIGRTEEIIIRPIE